MTEDHTKGLTVSYNLLNQPLEVEINNTSTKAKNKYIYTAAGSKLKVTYLEAIERQQTPLRGAILNEDELTEVRTVDYVSNKIYEDGVLSKILLGSGYYDTQDKKYYFYVSDHLGNNRVVADIEGNVGQSTEYYPFGLQFADGTGPEKQAYKYNGKEFDQMHNLNWYDYAARQYDPIVPHLPTPDPHSENYYSWSPYVYVGNNPMKFTDPTGMDWVERIVDGIKEIYYDRSVRSQDDVNIKYGSDGGVTHLANGTTYASYDKYGNILAQFNFFNDASANNEYGAITDGDGDLYPDDQVMKGHKFTIFGTSNKSTDAETVHKNYMWGPSYLGSNNPKDYNGDDSYQYESRLIDDFFPEIHDKDYDAKKAKGVMDALFNTNVLVADLKLVAGSSAIALAPPPFVTLPQRARAGAVVVGFGAISAFKLTTYPVLHPINILFNRKK